MELWYNIRHEETARKQAQQGVSPDKPDCPQGVLPGRRRAGEVHRRHNQLGSDPARMITAATGMKHKVGMTVDTYDESSYVFGRKLFDKYDTKITLNEFCAAFNQLVAELHCEKQTQMVDIMICRHVVFAMRRQKKPGTVGPRKQDGNHERRTICDYCGSC